MNTATYWSHIKNNTGNNKFLGHYCLRVMESLCGYWVVFKFPALELVKLVKPFYIFFDYCRFIFKLEKIVFTFWLFVSCKFVGATTVLILLPTSHEYSNNSCYLRCMYEQKYDRMYVECFELWFLAVITVGIYVFQFTPVIIYLLIVSCILLQL